MQLGCMLILLRHLLASLFIPNCVVLCRVVPCVCPAGAPACKKINDYNQCGGEGQTCPAELNGKCIDGPWQGESCWCCYCR